MKKIFIGNPRLQNRHIHWLEPLYTIFEQKMRIQLTAESVMMHYNQKLRISKGKVRQH